MQSKFVYVSWSSGLQTGCIHKGVYCSGTYHEYTVQVYQYRYIAI